MNRRRALQLLAAGSLVPLLGCGDAQGSTATGGDLGGDLGTDTASAADGSGDAGPDAEPDTCATIPEETAGPFPGDGTNGPDALSLTGVVRSDIRSSLGGATGAAEGVPLTLRLTLVDGATCAALAGYAIYVWHCDRDADYSMYTGAATAENYLRGVQETDTEGTVSFTTIFPGCYPGRWPHVHFEVYASLADASGGAGEVATSQLAFPEAACGEVYASAGYDASLTNLGRITLETDGVFRDGVEHQLATASGSVAAGYVAELTLAIAA